LNFTPVPGLPIKSKAHGIVENFNISRRGTNRGTGHRVKRYCVFGTHAGLRLGAPKAEKYFEISSGAPDAGPLTRSNLALWEGNSSHPQVSRSWGMGWPEKIRSTWMFKPATAAGNHRPGVQFPHAGPAARHSPGTQNFPRGNGGIVETLPKGVLGTAPARIHIYTHPATHGPGLRRVRNFFPGGPGFGKMPGKRSGSDSGPPSPHSL